eukprot:7338774-Heterocapsa_arctica.AAC.1
MKEVVRNKEKKRKELEKPPQELMKAKKVKRRGETSERVQIGAAMRHHSYGCKRRRRRIIVYEEHSVRKRT